MLSYSLNHLLVGRWVPTANQQVIQPCACVWVRAVSYKKRHITSVNGACKHIFCMCISVHGCVPYLRKSHPEFFGNLMHTRDVNVNCYYVLHACVIYVSLQGGLCNVYTYKLWNVCYM